jgi:hypothetical protein
MPCHHVDLGNGTRAIICTRGRTQRCKYCGRPSTKLCDWPLAGEKKGKTCDIPMCERCAAHIEPDTDYCKAHNALYLEQPKQPWIQPGGPA